MNYAVIWTKKALNHLAQAWIEATDRTSVQRASNRIDNMLGTSPLAYGESRSGADRLLFESPLAVYFRVDEADRKVFVLAIKLI